VRYRRIGTPVGRGGIFTLIATLCVALAAGGCNGEPREVRAAGAYDSIAIAGGQPAPFYLVNFDKGGRCESPGTRDELLRVVRAGTGAGAFTDVFVISTGGTTTGPPQPAFTTTSSATSRVCGPGTIWAGRTARCSSASSGPAPC